MPRGMGGNAMGLIWRPATCGRIRDGPKRTGRAAGRFLRSRAQCSLDHDRWAAMQRKGLCPRRLRAPRSAAPLNGVRRNAGGLLNRSDRPCQPVARFRGDRVQILVGRHRDHRVRLDRFDADGVPLLTYDDVARQQQADPRLDRESLGLSTYFQGGALAGQILFESIHASITSCSRSDRKRNHRSRTPA